MTLVRWNRRSPLAIGSVLVTQEHQAELVRAFREAWRPATNSVGATPPNSRPPIAVHEVRVRRRRRG